MARRRWNDRHENVSISQLFIHSSSAVVRGKFSMDDFSTSFDRFTQRLRVTSETPPNSTAGLNYRNENSMDLKKIIRQPLGPRCQAARLHLKFSNEDSAKPAAQCHEQTAPLLVEVGSG